MMQIKNGKHRKLKLIVAWVAIFCWTGVFAVDDPLQGLAGPPFMAPDEIFPMPKSWVERPVRHIASKPAVLVVTLDQQLYPMLDPLIEKFAKEHKVEIIVQKGTCGISAGDLAEKTVDIGGFCCAPDLTDRLPGLRFHTLGIGALALIVHPHNAVDDLKIADARKIFAGEIRRWSEVPAGPGKKGDKLIIRSVARLHCKLRPGHWRLLLDNEDMFGPDILEVAAIPDMIRQVEKFRSAIGYETLWHIRRLSKHKRVKLLRLNGVDPSDKAALAAGKYPLYRVFNVTTWENSPAANPLADRLVAYLLQKANDLDPMTGIIPAKQLRQSGWLFKGAELIGEPNKRQ
ncbi:MAG: hypothetical protein GY862_13440 [Gammaproteobacteria bacterium]|nr:hypothetical protein [Gammaproteobacteria bacterium]